MKQKFHLHGNNWEKSTNEPQPSKLNSEFFEKKIDIEKSLVVENAEWLTTEGAAEYLKISAQSLRNLTSKGKIPYYKWQSRNRYLKSDLKNLLFSNKRGGIYGNQI